MKLYFNEKDKNVNVYKILLKSNKVNYYTKMLLILNNLNYFEDYYIPNKKLMKMLGIDKKNVIRILKQLEEENIISIYYKDRKRFFMFKVYSKKEKKKMKNEIFDYDWLTDDEEE